MNKNKYFLLCVLSISFCLLFSAKANAKNNDDKPNIVWPHIAVDTIKDRPDKLVDKDICLAVSKMVDDKLQELKNEESLDFNLVDKENAANPFDFSQNSEPQVTLIPLIVNDNTEDSFVTYEGQKHYTSIALCQIDIAFCYYPGSGENLRVLKVIPLSGFSQPGSDGEHTSKISLAEKKQEFISNAGHLINEFLDFGKDKKFFDMLKKKNYTDYTYQVTAVDVTSEAVKKFYGNDLHWAQALIGSIYTSAFAAKHPEYAVLPAATNDGWAATAAAGTTTLNLGNSGKYLVLQPADKQIKLELSMVGKFDVPQKHDTGIYKFIGFAAELKNNTDGIQVKDHVEKRFIAKNSYQVSNAYYTRGILIELFRKTAVNLAER